MTWDAVGYQGRGWGASGDRDIGRSGNRGIENRKANQQASGDRGNKIFAHLIHGKPGQIHVDVTDRERAAQAAGNQVL